MPNPQGTQSPGGPPVEHHLALTVVIQEMGGEDWSFRKSLQISHLGVFGKVKTTKFVPFPPVSTLGNCVKINKQFKTWTNPVKN